MSKSPEETFLEKVVSYKRALGGESGKIVMEDLKDRSGVEMCSTDFSQGALAYNEGRRAMFLEIKAILETDISELKKNLSDNEEEEE